MALKQNDYAKAEHVLNEAEIYSRELISDLKRMLDIITAS